MEWEEKFVFDLTVAVKKCNTGILLFRFALS